MVWFWVSIGGVGGGGGVRFVAASEMPRSYVRNVEQAQVIPPVSKSRLTKYCQ